MRFAIGFAFLFQTVLLAQTPGPAPIVSGEKVDLKGTVLRVNAAPGQGMPSLEVKTGSDTVMVSLGSMRYLMQNEFNPKAGDPVVVKGYKMKEGVVAIEVTLAGRKPLAFRDDQGRPLWSRGMNGRKGRMSHDQTEK